MRARRLAASACLAVFLSGCGVDPEAGTVEPEEAAPPAEVVVEGLEALVSDTEIDLAYPGAIDIDGAGNLWVADSRLHQVLVIGPAGEVLRTVGRNGEGPGEFRGPRGLGIRGDHAYVLDNFHGVQLFDMAGDYVSTYSPPRAFTRDLDFVGDGGLVMGGNRVWARGGLISAIGPDGEERGLIGELPFPDLSFDFMALREQTMEGVIPDVLRNGSLPVAAPDGSLWVVMHTESRLRRYGADGELLFEAPFELPELPAIEAQYYENFRNAPAGDAFFFPSFAADGFATNDYLLVLWNTVPGSPGLITVHDDTGALLQRVLLPQLDMGGGAFTPGFGFDLLRMALDETRRRLYIASTDIATIFAVDLPDSLVF